MRGLLSAGPSRISSRGETAPRAQPVAWRAGSRGRKWQGLYLVAQKVLLQLRCAPCKPRARRLLRFPGPTGIRRHEVRADLGRRRRRVDAGSRAAIPPVRVLSWRAGKDLKRLDQMSVCSQAQTEAGGPPGRVVSVGFESQPAAKRIRQRAQQTTRVSVAKWSHRVPQAAWTPAIRLPDTATAGGAPRPKPSVARSGAMDSRFSAKSRSAETIPLSRRHRADRAMRVCVRHGPSSRAPRRAPPPATCKARRPPVTTQERIPMMPPPMSAW